MDHVLIFLDYCEGFGFLLLLRSINDFGHSIFKASDLIVRLKTTKALMLFCEAHD